MENSTQLALRLPERVVDVLVVGAGVSGLACANAIRARAPHLSVLVLEREDTPGGYCRTVRQDGFVWDYSGHFFHFRHPHIEAWLRERMPEGSVSTVTKQSRVVVSTRDGAVEVDFPFQRNIHQLPKSELLDCLADLRDAERAVPQTRTRSFKAMLEGRYGKRMCELFLIPYNEKLYATDLDALDATAMGRFFPNASLDDALAQIRRPNNASYNDTFTYPRGGAEQYIHALLRDLHPLQLALRENVKSIDLDEHVVTTSKRRIAYQHLVTSAPLADTLAMTNLSYDAGAFTANQVLVFNLGFDSKGRSDAHWVYYSDPSLRFYRVGYYDNIHADDTALSARMSLYVEVGLPEGVTPNVDAERARVLADLSRAGVVTTQKLVSSHSVTMRPAYVHITGRSLHESCVQRELLRSLDVHSIGRYGAWTYCSIEDNIVEARAVAAQIAGE